MRKNLLTNYIVDLKGYTLNLGDESLYIEGNVTIQNGAILSTDDYVIRTRQYVYPNMDAEESNITLKNITMNGGLNMFMTDSYFYNCDLDASDKVHYAIYLEKTGSTATVYSGKYAGNYKALCAADGTNFVLYGGSYNSNPTASWVATDHHSEQIGTTGIYCVYKEKYSRDLTSSNIGTICLPRKVDVGCIDGATAYELAYKEGEEATFLDVDGMKAGKSYVFKPTANKVTFYMIGDVVANPVNENGFYGTFTGINTAMQASSTELTNKYIISNNVIQKCGNGCWLNANRAYIVWDEISGDQQAPAPGRKLLTLGNGKSTPTDLVEMQNAECTMQNGKFILNGQFIIVMDGKKFNAQGAAL